MAQKWIKIDITDADIRECMRYGNLMRDGGVGLQNVKYGDRDNFENYTDGKISELAVKRHFLNQKIKIVHEPFRDDYTVINHKDDFIIILDDHRIRVEVRHKTRNRDPRTIFDHCSNSIQDDRLYVFTERCRSGNAPGKGEQPELRHFRGTVNIVGFIFAEQFRQAHRLVPRGTLENDPAGKYLFTTHRDEYRLHIEDMMEISLLHRLDLIHEE